MRSILLAVVSIVLIDQIIMHVFFPIYKSMLGLEDNIQVIEKNQEFGYSFIPNLKKKRWFGEEYQFYSNSLGFRDSAQRKVPVVGEKPRLLVIGDSFTEGVGVDFEKTFVGILSASNDVVEILNAGVSSYSPIIYLKKIRHLVDTVGFKFDRLLVLLDISDIFDEATRAGKLSPSPLVVGKLAAANNRELNLKQMLRDNIFIVHAAYKIKDMYKWSVDFEGEIKKLHKVRGTWTIDPDMMDAYGKKGLKFSERHMTELRTFLSDRGIGLSLAVYPWPHQILARDRHSIMVKFWQDWARRQDVSFIDLFPFFINEEKPIKTVRENFITGDVHWNASGHRKIAGGLMENWDRIAPGKDEN